MNTLLKAISEGVQELAHCAAPNDQYAVRNACELRSEYRRLKQMHAEDASQIFPNSRMLPVAKTFTKDETMAKNYWNHIRSGLSFDCCPLHLSRKQLLLELMESERQIDHMNAMTNDDNVVKLQSKTELLENQKRKEMMDKIFAIDANAPLRKIRNRELATTDTDSLRYQLHLTKERLETMQRRTLKIAG